jgi:hypothetical protein
MDWVFVAFAAFDVLFVVGMVVAAMQMLKTTQKGMEKAGPAIRELNALRESGTAMANHLKTDGLASAKRIKAVAEAVKRRVATTRRILGEIRPHAQETSLRVRETSADLSQQARSANDMVQRLSRLRSAAVAASQAARKP